ncbi:MAG: hypothetical protein MUO26_03325 [Methanotrichaceae archaeon]|nr:hypothetical protein [Methanotrichaceae archaeon]
MYRTILVGTLTFLPGANFIISQIGTAYPNGLISKVLSDSEIDIARYGYSVWLRHLVMALGNDPKSIPKTVLEFGPGDSLGIGLAALLSGAEKYYALDVIKYADIDKNLKIFNELVKLFKKRESIPTNIEFPEVRPVLESYEFPHNILTEDVLDISLNDERIKLIKNNIANIYKKKNEMIQYSAPWDDPGIVGPQSVDMAISQAVLEHIENLEDIYRLLSLWLVGGGVMSHTIDLKSHGCSNKWNGQLTYSDPIWRLMKGNRKYFLNRYTYSSHIEIQKKYHFNILIINKDFRSSDVSRDELNPRFKSLPDEDLEISTVYILSNKVPS